jgi:hypothetical protein
MAIDNDAPPGVGMLIENVDLENHILGLDQLG